MTSRSVKTLHRVHAWSAVLFSFTLTAPAFAQPEDESKSGVAVSEESTGTKEDEDEGMAYEAGDQAGAAAVSEAPAADETKSEPTQEEEQPTSTAEPEEEVPLPPPPMGDDETVAFMGVERLPASAYPAPRTRGIAGGSLWMTMHGLQWPYMPYIQGSPAFRIGVSGSVWVDQSYRKIDTDPELAIAGTDERIEQWPQQGRLVLRGTPTYSTPDDWFVQGQGELVANSDQTQSQDSSDGQVVDTDDLYVRAGKWHVFDVTAGRFQGWEVYHFGMGLDLNTVERIGAWGTGPQPVGIYGVTYFWDRSSAGGLAAHFYPTDFLRFEVGGQLGNDQSGLNVLAARPVGVLDMGFIKVKLGAEYGRLASPLRQVCSGFIAGTTDPRCSRQSPRTIIRRGGGGMLEFVVDPYVEFGFGGARALVDETIDQIDPVTGVAPINEGRSFTVTSYGGFANGRIVDNLIVGLGVNYTDWNNLEQNPVTFENYNKNHLQTFFAIQYAFWQQLYIKLVTAYAAAQDNPLQNEIPQLTENKAYSARLRFLFAF